MTVTAMHTADIHADTAHHGKLNPLTGLDKACESNIASLAYLVTEAIRNNVSIFILPGDLFSHGKPAMEHLLLLAETLKPLVHAGIPIELDVGNHERLFVPTKFRTSADVIGEMLGTTVHIVSDIELKHYGFMDVLTVPYPSKSRILSLIGETKVDPTKGDGLVVRYVLEQMEKKLQDRDDSVPLVISGHFTVDGIGLPGSEHDIANLMNEVVFPMQKIEDMDPDYVALGHIHTPQKLGTKTYYAGSPNKLTFTDANDIKGGNLVTLGKELDVQRVLTPVRGMYKVDLSKEDFELELKEDDVVQVILPEGQTEIPKKLKKDAEALGASLIAKIRPIKKAPVARTVLPEKISPINALETYLKDQGISKEMQKYLIDKAKTLEVKGNDK